MSSIQEIPYHVSPQLSKITRMNPRKTAQAFFCSLPLSKHLLWAALRDRHWWTSTTASPFLCPKDCMWLRCLLHCCCFVEPPAEKYFSNWQNAVLGSIAVHYPHLGCFCLIGENSSSVACSWEFQQVYCFYGKRINHSEHFFWIPLVFLRSEAIND